MPQSAVANCGHLHHAGLEPALPSVLLFCPLRTLQEARLCLSHCSSPPSYTAVRRRDPQSSLALLAARVGRLERQHAQLVRLCLHCGGGGGRVVPHGVGLGAGAGAGGGGGGGRGAGGGRGQGGGGAGGTPACVVNGYNAGCGGVVCDSLDCGVYYERRKVAGELAALGGLLGSVGALWPDEE